MLEIEFVGAGPGDPDLLTLAAAERLARADRVWVDAAVRDAVAAHVGAKVEVSPADASLMHVPAMIAAARAGLRVVRALRGDPLFLGGAQPEIAAVAAAGVPVAIVPGIPALVAAAARAGLALEAPLSIGGLGEAAQSIVLEADAEPSDVDGLRARLAAAGVDEVTTTVSLPWPPARGARPVATSLGALGAALAHGRVPAFVAAGARLAAAPPFGWLARRPLHGKVVAITRAATQAGETARAVRARGGLPLEAPTIAIQPPADGAPLARAARDIGSYDVVAFTSANGVDALFEAIRDAGLDARAFGRALIAVIGPGTARALAPYGVRADLAAEEHRGEGLAAAIAEKLGGVVAGRRVLLARATVARDALPDTLRAAGAYVDVVPAYESVAASVEALAPLRTALLAGEVDVVTFTASSTATRFCEAFPDAQALLAETLIASIGPITSDTLRARGLRVDVEAKPFTIPALLDAIEAHFATSR
jgi:uroporphyrinogen III methyltransferase/synthase